MRQFSKPRGAAQDSQASQNSPAARLLERCLAEAHRLGASDLHLEPEVGGLSVRARIDGSLWEMAPPPPSLAAAFLARLRLLAGADLAERRMPQDGRFRLDLGEQSFVDIRCAFLPVVRGEKVTLRLLNRQDTPRSLGALGLDGTQEQQLRLHLERADGLIIVVGPTGSGKTTTLYACMEETRRRDRSLVSVEDPVEVELSNVAQVPVHEEIGRGFAPVLRALLRHDPDVMMVGEIRDSESASIACRAALTGHLVLSSLHATDATEVPARLRDMDVPDYLIQTTLRLIVAQRLLRRPCEHCKTTSRSSEQESHWFEMVALETPANLTRTHGCSRCQETGYRGRLPVFALSSGASSSTSGDLLRSGLKRVAAGKTTLQEVLARCPLGDARRLSKAAKGDPSRDEKG